MLSLISTYNNGNEQYKLITRQLYLFDLEPDVLLDTIGHWIQRCAVVSQDLQTCMKRLFSGLLSRAGGSTTLSSSSSAQTVVGGTITSWPCDSLSTDVSSKHEPGTASRAIKGTKWSTFILAPCCVFCSEADVHKMLMACSVCTSWPVTRLCS